MVVRLLCSAACDEPPSILASRTFSAFPSIMLYVRRLAGLISSRPIVAVA